MTTTRKRAGAGATDTVPSAEPDLAAPDLAGEAAEGLSDGSADGLADEALDEAPAEPVAGMAELVAEGAEPTEAGADGTDGDGGSDGTDGPGAEARTAARPWRRRPSWLDTRRRVAAAAVAAVLLLCSGGLLYAQRQLTDPAASGNHALTDSPATDQVIGDVSSALSQIFAYTPDDTQATDTAARQVLAGTAAAQYQALYAQIRTSVAEQQLTLTTRVVRAGVVSLTGDRARLLVFLDQTAQRAGSTATSASAQLSVTAEYTGGHWRITELKAR